MVAYLVIFSLTTLLIALSEDVHKRRRNTIAILMGYTAVLTLSIMAGIRSYDVGTDMNYYILPFFYRARRYSTSFHDFWKANVENVEILFLFLEYIAVRLFHSPHFVLFALSLLTNGFVYLGIMKQRGKMSVAFAWMTYCLIYFNVSLNLMRQSVSIAIFFYLYSDLEKLNWKRVVFFSVFSSLFHISGLIGFFFYAVYLMICRRNRIDGLRKIMFLLFLLLPVIIPIAINTIISIMRLNQRYDIYMENQANMAVGNLIFRVLIVISFVLLCYRTKSEDKSQNYFLLYVGIMNIFFIINNGLIFIRLRFYFEIFSLLYVPAGLRVYSRKKGARTLISALMVIMMIVYWYYQFIYLNNGETYPYSIDPFWMKGLS